MNPNESAPNPLLAKSFVWEANDPLAAEHELVSRHIFETLAHNWKPPPTSFPEELQRAFESLLRHWAAGLNCDEPEPLLRYWTGDFNYDKPDLKQTAAGRKILETDAEGSARLVLALTLQVTHYEEIHRANRTLLAAKRTDETQRINGINWKARGTCAEGVRQLLRRKLPLTSVHLAKLAEWIVSSESSASEMFYPLNAFVKAVENYGVVDPDNVPLHSALSNIARRFRSGSYKGFHKLAQKLETALNSASAPESAEAEQSQPPAVGPNPAQPALAGSPHILVRLKQTLDILPADDGVTTESIGIDHFPLRADSPLRKEHELISQLLPEVIEQNNRFGPELSSLKTGRVIMECDDVSRGKMLLAASERHVNAHFLHPAHEDRQGWAVWSAARGVFEAVRKTQPQLDRDGLFDLLLFFVGELYSHYFIDGKALTYPGFVKQLLPIVEAQAAHTPLTHGERHVLYRLRLRFVLTAPFGRPADEIVKLNQLIGDQMVMALVPGEVWADAVNADMGMILRADREMWLELLRHCAAATGSRPSVIWLKTANACLTKLGREKFHKALQRWFPLVSDTRSVQSIGLVDPRTITGPMIQESNSDCLRGLLWMSPAVVSPELIRVIGALTVSCYRKLPGIGPRAVKVGNAGVYALSQINDPLALGQLALLKAKVKFGSAQKEIEKAFNAAAERSGLPREELEEMSVPTYGLTSVGICEEPMGDHTAELTIAGSDTTPISWIKADGKRQQSVPAVIKEKFADDWKEFQNAAKDIQRMLPAQRERIDNLFREQKTWPFEKWRERYLNQPLVGVLARKLIWDFTSGGQTTTGIFFNGNLLDIDLRPLPKPDEKTTVQLWHPIGKNADEIVGWRAWLDAQQIQQPFKQAHREVYLLTDAERRTRTYSNRFAAHIVRQHQFNALCGARGWKNKLRLLVDDTYPPATVLLPKWNLRAEFWIEGLGNNFGTDTNDSGVFNYLATNQVRFYRLDTMQRTAHAGGGGYHPGRHDEEVEPLPLDEIPPLIYSEVMRDVDLFVGVASVGNDPTWNDGGPEGRHHEYWQNYSFGELNASAKTRREVLERLMPRLKIAGQCSFTERFLVVKGSLRTYKIHLGSGNIQMEPNNQYLCIVPNSSTAAKGGDKFFLPFEGDRTLSVIISKAFLLADDAKIKDPTIVSQIKRA